MKDVSISVFSRQSDGSGEDSVIDYNVFGKYLFYDHDIRISYFEPESADMGKTKTHIRITEDAVIIRREGSLSSKLTLKENEKIPFLYRTPYGTIEMAAEAKRVLNGLNADGGKLILDYDMFVRGEKTARNELLLTISKM